MNCRSFDEGLKEAATAYFKNYPTNHVVRFKSGTY
jgi:hypothetical protein